MKCPKILSLLLMILLLSTGYASAAPSQTLKIAAGDPEDSEMGVVGNAFKEYIEEKTKGDVEIQCFYSGSLGDESECLRNVQKGTLPMAMAGIANLVPFEKKLGLLTLPYLFANIDEVVAGTNGAPAELLNKYATKAGFRILTPFGGEDREIVSTFPVTDTVIVGTVPERYAYIGSAGEGLLGEVRDGSSE